MHFVDLELGFGDNLVHRYAVDHGRYGDETLTVLTFDRRGSETLHDCAEFLKSDRVPGGGVDHDILDIRYLRAACRIIHDLDIVLLSILTEL